MNTYRYAQTNLQLYSQAIDAGYSERELQALMKSYTLVATLFASRYRGNGKPFLAHLVGTSSILLRHGGDVSTTLAGLLHASYQQGDFSKVNISSTEAMRRYVVNLLGKDVEQLVAHYTGLKWDPGTINGFVKSYQRMKPLGKKIALMRLANTLEDYIDLGIAYSDKDKYEREPGRVLKAVELARCLGYHQLAKEIEYNYQANISARLPSVLKRNKPDEIASVETVVQASSVK